MSHKAIKIIGIGDRFVLLDGEYYLYATKNGDRQFNYCPVKLKNGKLVLLYK